MPLATLLPLQANSGSFSFAGVAAGAQSLAIGAGGIVMGRLAEHFGPRRVGAVAAATNAAALLLLIVSTHAGRACMLAAAIAVGLSQPQVGPLVRVHWSAMSRIRTEGSQFLTTALAYEAAADEASFVLGPMFVGLLAVINTPFGPVAPLAAGAFLLLFAAVPFALRYTENPQKKVTFDTLTDRIPVAALTLLVAAMIAMGSIFGALQTAVAAYAGSLDRPGTAGLLYAELGAGSALAGLACAWLPQRFTLKSRYLTFAMVLLLAMSLLAFGGAPLWLGMALAGASVAPYMISIYALTERLAPARVVITMTVLAAGGPIGTAIGQTVAGTFTTDGAPLAGVQLTPIIAGIAVLLTLATRLLDANRYHRA
jgi:MFS family permease